MDLRTALKQGAELLASANVSEPRLTAEVLLSRALGQDRVYLFTWPERELREVEWIHYGRWLHERMQGKPLQYITRVQEFYGRPFSVSPDVLIPRPETEILIETVLRRSPQARIIADVGTGSGAIAVTLHQELKAAVVGVDLSIAALRVAVNNGLATPLCGDLLSAIGDESVDAVVSNPPYVSVNDRETLQREVRDWEPELALFAGPDGLDVYRKLIPDAWRVLKPGGLLAVEIGLGQSDSVSALLATWAGLEVASDLAGIPRVLSCEKPL